MSETGSSPSWADPGYFLGESRIRNTGRVLWQLIRPPKGHRTLPTKTGIMLILITLGLGTAAFNTSHNILYIALALLLTSLLLSGILSWINFKGCRWRVQTTSHFRADESSAVYLEVENTKRYIPTYSLQFILSAKQLQMREILRLAERLEPGQTHELEWLFKPEKRGLETIALDGLVSKFPFGFLRKSISDSFQKEIEIWPRREDYRFNPNSSRQSRKHGPESKQRGQGAELINLREYQQRGDPLRQVHWKASAKMNKLFVRETAEEKKEAYSLTVEPSPNIWSSEQAFEKMCAVAGTMAEDLFKRDQLTSCTIQGAGHWKINQLSDVHHFLSGLARLDYGEKFEIDKEPVQGPTLRYRPLGKDRVKILLDNHVAGEA